MDEVIQELNKLQTQGNCNFEKLYETLIAIAEDRTNLRLLLLEVRMALVAGDNHEDIIKMIDGGMDK